MLALFLGAGMNRSMGWMLEAAGLDAGGPSGALRAKGLGVVWLAGLRAWEKDESEDLSATMAALDRALDQADRVARMLRFAPKELMPDADAEPSPDAEPTPDPV